MDGSKFILRAHQVLLAVALAATASSPAAAAERILFPEEELASESVLPVFDHPVSVRNRSIYTGGRFEVGLAGGYSLMEPFYSPMSFGGTGTYHFNEEHAVSVLGFTFMQGLSENGKGLNPIPGSGGVNANLQYAPAPKYLLLVDYQFNAYYGKISLSKEVVMNLGLYGFAGGGLFGIGDAPKPVLNAGIGQKIYITRNIALRIDLHFLAYQGPDVVSRALHTVNSEQPSASFDQRLYLSSFLNFGGVFLF